VAVTLTAQEVDDPSQVATLLDQIRGENEQFTADGAYDGEPTYETTAAQPRHCGGDSASGHVGGAA